MAVGGDDDSASKLASAVESAAIAVAVRINLFDCRRLDHGSTACAAALDEQRVQMLAAQRPAPSAGPVGKRCGEHPVTGEQADAADLRAGPPMKLLRDAESFE